MPLDSYVSLGRSGLKVSPFCLGAMNFGEDGGMGCSVEEAQQILRTYLDRGGNFIDTANFYTNGHSEKILGDFFAQRPGLRDRVVLATKFFGNLHLGDPNGGGAGRKAILGQLEDSLRRLRTDYIDLYWLHNYDWSTPVEETLRTLDDLVTAGRIRYVGFSDTPAWFMAKAHTAISAAFTGDVTLYGKADTGDGDPTIRQELKPGTYPITAHCGANHTVQGQIAVAANVPSAGHQQNRRTADYRLLASAALILAAIAGAVLLRRHGRG
jgi:hypothetical protein